MIPADRGLVLVGFLFRLLSISIQLGVSSVMKTELIRRASLQFEEATVNNLLYSLTSSSDQNYYDIEFVLAVICPIGIGIGFSKRCLERKWPERAKGTKGTKGSQKNLEGHSRTRCVCISEAMRMHPIRGRHAQKAVSAQMRTHSELLSVRISGSQHL
ncbi:hypothetical protein PIB30_013276 [Stylosanthes scabra]|uniref:NPH3 domain-containing protein n=1 Tax=Stylosanthes scabra TaxID=79078 RepID=A0ABU6S6N7_9FABA|nr:hypothetical protein [Stylosanthes scabra]